MNINLPPKVRLGVYIFTAFGSPFIAYLRFIGVLDDAAVALWSAEVSVASALAAINVNLGNK